MNPNRILELVKPFVIIFLCIFAMVLIYGFFTNEDYDDEDTVTVTFSCSDVLGKPSNFPEYVINECRDIRANAK
jgi:hypothetical protein